MNTGVLNVSDGNSVQTGTYFIGTVSRTNTDANGTVAVTGIGFQPSHIHFQSNINLDASASFGYSDGTIHKAKSENHNEVADDWENRVGNCIAARTGFSIANNAVVSSLDVDGFTLTWTKQGAPTGVTVVNYIAIK